MLTLLKNKYILLILTLTFLTYLPVLFNDFVGDDHVLVETNSFYTSWHNAARLFSQAYITRPKDLFVNTTSDHGTGSVSYRPVLSLSYFIDKHCWGNKAFGFHLTNVVIHCANCILLYQILLLILGVAPLSCFAALLFGLHPILSEAVAVIGYRADILAAFFVLASFYCWIKFRSKDILNIKYYLSSLVLFFLALFSKESAVMLPFIIFVYDQWLSRWSRSFSKRLPYYISFLALLVFYLWVYFIVFPNSSMPKHWLGESLINHCLISTAIGYKYVTGLLFPWTVNLIPGTYCPSPFPIISWEALKIVLVFSALIWVLWKFWKIDRAVFFFFSWFLIFYLPVSNLIPIANPIAMRFMYLPSMGALTVLAFFLDRACNSLVIKNYAEKLSLILRGALIALCIILTLILNNNWKDDLHVAFAWIKNYPTAPRSYLILAHAYENKNYYKEAAEYFELAFQYGDREPQEILSRGICYLKLGELEKAKSCFLDIISQIPDQVADPYIGLGDVYHLQKDSAHELWAMQKALSLDPKNSFVINHLARLKADRGDHK